MGAVTSGLPDLQTPPPGEQPETAGLHGEFDPTGAHWVWASSQMDVARNPDLEALGCLSSSQHHPQLTTKGEGPNQTNQLMEVFAFQLHSC